MPRPAHTNEQKEDIRNRIQSAAANLYQRDNGENLTARSVAREAGVSTGTLYIYFNSLSEILQSLWRGPTHELVEEMTTLASDIECPGTRLRVLLNAYVEFASENTAVFRNFYLYVRPEANSPPPRTPVQRDRFFQLYRTTIGEGQELGVFREGDPDELTQLVVSAVHGSLSLPINLHRLALDPSSKVPCLVVDAMLDWLQPSKQRQSSKPNS